MTPEIQYQLKDIGKKASIMQGLLDSGTVEQTRIPLANFATQSLFWGPMVRSYFVSGLENLEAAIHEGEVSGRRIILSPRHEADADHLVLRYILRREGFEDFMNRAVFPAGVNMLKRPGVRIFMRSEHVIYIATPGDFTLSRTLSREGERFGLTDEDVKMVVDARKVFGKINQAAATLFAEAAQRGDVVVPYIEAGRSYDGWMKIPARDMAEYFPKDDSALVLPIRFYGAKEINPPNRMFRFYKALPFLGGRIGMAIGKYYPSREVWDWVEKRNHDTNPAKMAAAHIANLDPTDIRVEELIEYQRLIALNHPEGY